MTAPVQPYTYLRPSAVRDSGAGHALTLETSGDAASPGSAAHPRFFGGFLTAPAPAAAAIRTVAEVATARFDRPSGSAADPVVTAGDGQLRLESFSGCCGVYSRLDILPPGLDGDEVEHGTTNVDINPPLRRALAVLGGLDPLHLAVGPRALEIETLDGQFVEKRVRLPQRWVRGFAETQVIAADMTPRAEVPVTQAADLLRTLPRSTNGAAPRTTRWVVPTGQRLRPTSRPSPGAVCLPAAERLPALDPVLRHATTVRLYAPVDAGNEPAPVAWEFGLPGMRLVVMLSVGPNRGFSGEGGVLNDLASDTAETDAADLLSMSSIWEARVTVRGLADRAGLPHERARAALTLLAASGLLGYDLAEEAYFARRFPFSTDDAQVRNPRLRAARKLVADGAVQLDGALARIGSGDGVTIVRADESGALSCTCRWWASYRGARGPCRHVLAARMVRNAFEKGTP